MDEVSLDMSQSLTSQSHVIAQRLSDRRHEIAELMYIHISRLSRPSGNTDYGDAFHLRTAIAGMVESTIESIQGGDDHSVPIPNAVIVYARTSARRGVALEAVLQDAIAGHTLLSEAICREAENVSRQALRHTLALQGSILQRMAKAASREYLDERTRVTTSSSRRRSALVERLLLGTEIDETKLAYVLDAWHVGLISEGDRAATIVRDLAEAMGSALLMVPNGQRVVWAWIGSRQMPAREAIQGALIDIDIAEARLALGEPARGVAGCRKTHAEALAAFSVAVRSPPGAIYFSNVALEAMALRAPEVARSLQAIYLEPLRRHSRGSILRRTLEAYLTAQRNVSSAAAALGVSRRTVENRLRALEEEIGHPVQRCATEIDVALRVARLVGPELEPTAAGCSRGRPPEVSQSA